MMKLALFLFAFAAVASAQQDIPATLIEAESFTTLVAALQAADLVQPLSAPSGPFTVFAPTDDAFAALPAGLVDCLVMPKNKEVLSKILTYHVVDGSFRSTDLSNGQVVPTLNGANVTIDLTNGVMINDAVVSTVDVEASNGIIHIIESGT